MLRPLLEKGDRVIDIETGEDYEIEGNIATLVKNGKTYKVNLYHNHTDVPDYETGNYTIVRKSSKPSKKLETTTEPPTKPDEPPKGDKPTTPAETKPTTTKKETTTKKTK